MAREMIFRAVEKRLNEQAAQTSMQVDTLMEQLTKHVGSSPDGEEASAQELRRQEAFLKELLHSEEQKHDAEKAMQQELDKLSRVIEQLEKEIIVS